jgi:hypothetical protein
VKPSRTLCVPLKYSSGVDLEETADLLAYAALASLILSQVIGAKPKAEE